MPEYPRGSEWRKWDLHLHTPDGKLSNAYANAGSDSAWDRFIDILESSKVEAFGITDYFGCNAYFRAAEKYKAKYPKSRKVLFPNIELRLSESISANGSQPHLHIVFDNDPETCGQEILQRFCTHLQTQAEGNSNVRLRCTDLNTAAKLSAATVSLDDVLLALKETFGDAKPYMLVFPASNDGLRSTDSNSPRKVQLADRIDKMCNAFFGSASNRD